MDSSSENKTEDNTADFPAQHSKDSLPLSPPPPLFVGAWRKCVNLQAAGKKKIPQATIYITHHIQM